MTDDVLKTDKIILKLQLIILIRCSPVEYSKLLVPLTDISITLTAASGAQKSTPKTPFPGKKYLYYMYTHMQTHGKNVFTPQKW